MREILFRGKRVGNGEWLYGWVTTQHKKYTGGDLLTKIQSNTFGVGEYYVDTETVGQFTGLTDKNGKKIFEGDIVHAVYQVGYVGCKNVDYGIGVVKYCASYYGGASYEIDIIGDSGSRVFTASLENGVEVIGNIYDNPELIKEK